MPLTLNSRKETAKPSHMTLLVKNERPTAPPPSCRIISIGTCTSA